MNRQNLRIITTQSLLPLAAITLAASIFVVDTLTDLELAVPAFYTAVVLMSVRFCKRRGVILVGLGCIALTLLSDVLTSNTASTEAGLINTGISLSAIATTVYLGLRIESARAAAFEAQSQLAHVVRVTTLGELTASIAHEVNQPLAAVVINGNASLRWLADTPPNLDEARQAIGRIVKDANRASDVVARVRALTRSAPREREWVSMNDIILGTVMLTEREIARNYVALADPAGRRFAAGPGRPGAAPAGHPQSHSKRDRSRQHRSRWRQGTRGEFRARGFQSRAHRGAGFRRRTRRRSGSTACSTPSILPSLRAWAWA